MFLLPFLLLFFLPSSYCKLYLAQLITISQTPQIFIKTKFKFTDIMISDKTAQLLKQFDATDMQSIPQVPINNTGRIEKKYHKLDRENSVYLFSKRMGLEEAQEYLRVKVKENKDEKWVYIVSGAPDELSQSQLVCSSKANLTAVAKQTQKIQQIMKECFQHLHQTQSAAHSVSSFDQNDQKSDSSFTLQIIVGGLIIVGVSIVKMTLINWSGRRQSVV